MPDENKIATLKGLVDFYYYKGVPVARSWPKSPTLPRNENVQKGMAVFTAAAHLMKETSPEVIDAWKEMARHSPQTWRDYFMRGYMSGRR